MSKQFFAELPPVLTYVGSYLLADPESGHWTVFLTEWVCRVAATLLREVYDMYRLSPANTTPVVSYRADTPPRSPTPPRRTTSSPETAIRNFLRGAEFTRDDMKLDIIGLQALVRDVVRDARNYRSQKSAISKRGR